MFKSQKHVGDVTWDAAKGDLGAGDLECGEREDVREWGLWMMVGVMIVRERVHKGLMVWEEVSFGVLG